jgi:subtilisin family serine protease
VAVLDTGIWRTHEDLEPNLWRNPSEIPGNGIDDDGDGYIDDVNGINVITGSGDPTDDHGHGTHVSGIIGAAGNNTVGAVGVCWHVQILACKFLNSNAIGLVSDAIKAIDYARSKGAKIINLSWGDPAYGSQALRDAIASARDAGIIVVCACGNSDNDNDIAPLFPASFDLDNIISVAATTRNDVLASFSSYGATTVDLGAPGESIVSTWRGSDNNYTVESGTSMAAPMVAGACALAWGRYPTETYQEIIQRILRNTDPLPALTGKCVTGGRLNVQRALAAPYFEPLHETICLLSTTNVAVSWPSEPGKSYQVQIKSNLTTDAWQDIGGIISATTTHTWWTNDISEAMERYYIVKKLN